MTKAGFVSLEAEDDANRFLRAGLAKDLGGFLVSSVSSRVSWVAEDNFDAVVFVALLCEKVDLGGIDKVDAGEVGSQLLVEDIEPRLDYKGLHDG